MFAQQRIEFRNESFLQILIFSKLRDCQRAIPGASFGINHELPFAVFDLQFPRDKVFGNAFANFLRRSSSGPFREI